MIGRLTKPSVYRDLWDLAASQLNDKYKACINFNSTAKLDDLLAAVDDRKRECQQKQWTVERGPRRNAIVLRDVFTKIATWIEKFVECGDCIVQYDPGHAALPWAAVRFLLKVSVTDVQQYAVVLEGLETVSNLITRYQIMQKLYLEEETQAKHLLQSSIVALYNKILIFLCKAHRHYSTSTAKRLMRNILAFQDKFQAVLGEISQQDKKNQDYVLLVEAEIAKKRIERLGVLSSDDSVRCDDLRRQLSKMQQPIDRIEQQLRDIQDGLNGTERLNILQWLSIVPYKKHHEQTRRDILSGTGSWLLQQQQLLDWQMSSASSIMWLHGAPGSGKSKLVSLVIDRFIDDFEADRNPNPIYFYCQRNSAEPERSDPEAILRSLVRQMACLRPGGALLQPVLRAYDKRKQEAFADGSLNSHECTALILEMTQDRLITTIVIDALDECDPEKRGVLLEAFSTIIDDSTGLVKLFISSRDDQDIVLHLSKGPNLKIQASHNQSDITRYVNNEVDVIISSSKWRSGKVDEKLKHEIKLALIEKAQGMFRWVTMQLEFLCSLRLPSLVKKRLGMLPPNLLKIYDENYTQKFESYQEEERQTVKNAFRLLLCALGKLSTSGFLKALSVLDPENQPLSPDSLLDLCFNFIDTDSQLDVFRFAHLSVREYLESQSDYERDSNHVLAAECCVRFLSSDEVVKRYRLDAHIVTEDDSDSECSPYERSLHFGNAEDLGPILAPSDGSLWDDHALRHTDFHKYACISWAFHLANSGNFRLTSPLKEMSYNFIMDHQQATSLAYWVWNKDAYYYWRAMSSREYMKEHLCWAVARSRAADYLFAACVWGFDDLLEIRIGAGLNPVDCDDAYHSGKALFIAIRFGNYTAARLLLEHGADPDPDGGVFGSPLSDAVENGDLAMVRTLLIYRASQNDSKLLYKNDGTGSGLLARAICIGRLDIIRIILENGADANEAGVLKKAIQTENKDIVRLLLDNGADLNKDYDWNDSPLWDPARRGDLEMLRTLFKSGAHAPTEYKNSKGKKYPLSLLLKRFDADVVKLLREHGCSFEDEAELEAEEEE